jgi:hypothetical protein
MIRVEKSSKFCVSLGETSALTAMLGEDSLSGGSSASAADSGRLKKFASSEDIALDQAAA